MKGSARGSLSASSRRRLRRGRIRAGAAAAVARNRFRLGFWLEERQRRTARTQLLPVRSVAVIKGRMGDESRDRWRGKLHFRRLQAGEGREWDRRW